MADPITAGPEELRAERPPTTDRPLELLRRRDFRRAYVAVAISELGDAFQYVALMWVALVAGGPLGVIAVRLADSVPALVFGFHGGLVADRHDRRRTLVAADLVRFLALVPVAIAGLAGHLPLVALVVAAFALTAATTYFAPAYGALLPSLVERRNVQAANGLVRATADALSVAGWALAAALLAVLPISAFFALNAASFLISALLFRSVRQHGKGDAEREDRPRMWEGIAALRGRRALAVAVVALAVGVTISSGTWMVGVPQLVRATLDSGAGSFSLLAAAYAVGSITAGAFLARHPIRRKARASLLAWMLYLPGFTLFALATSLWPALAGAVAAGMGQSSAFLLITSAAQEEVPDQVLGRVMGLVTLVHRGAHATALLLVAPLFAIVPARAVFAGAAAALPAVGLVGLAAASGERGVARARDWRRNRRS